MRQVLHLVDTLEIGGAERVAVNLVNALPRDRYLPSLATTRRDGPLADLVAADVPRLRLDRARRFDVKAFWRLVEFIRRHRIRLVHAHGTALFLARIAAALPPRPVVVWHDHFGRYLTEQRPARLYRMATTGIGGVMTVNQPLAQWARDVLRVPADRVWYVPNFVRLSTDATAAAMSAMLPGSAETRLVAVANFRPQKDHRTLIAAMAYVVRSVPSAHLLLVGDLSDASYADAIRQAIAAHAIDAHVTILGPRRDVPAILRASAVGVLSSSSEGLPLALLEYGAAGLPAVATDVGECRAVLDDGRAGVIVPPSDPAALGVALVSLLESPDRRHALGARLRRHVEAEYGEAQGAQRVSDLYDRLLAGRAGTDDVPAEAHRGAPRINELRSHL